MTFPSNDQAALSQQRDLPDFDKYFGVNDFFVRSVRMGQKKPDYPPEEVNNTNRYYLVQHLNGEWNAMVCGQPPVDLFSRRPRVVIRWMH